MSIEAMKQMVEALEGFYEYGYDRLECYEHITAIKQAIAEAEKQEPVAWLKVNEDSWTISLDAEPDHIPLYTTPQQRTWVGLTEEEIDGLHEEIKVRLMGTFNTKDIYRAIEAKLKERNK